MFEAQNAGPTGGHLLLDRVLLLYALCHLHGPVLNFFIRVYILSSKRIQMLSADISANHYKGFVKKLQ